VKWVAKGSLPVHVEGVGLIDCNLYSQEKRMILHLVNLTSAGTWRSPVHEFIPVGPFEIRVRVDSESSPVEVKLIVTERVLQAEVADGWCRFQVDSILDHEVAVIG
jgi:hypothetical protein